MTDPAPSRGALPDDPRLVPDLVAVSPHQDDEVLSMGAAILEAVAAGQVVAVLLVSRGEASIVRTRGSLGRLRRRQLPAHLGFVPSPHHFSALRDREFDGAVRAMGATPIIPPYEDRLPDGLATPDAVTALFRAHVAPGTPALTISAHDSHPDHRACGVAVQRLVADGYVPEAGYFISPERLDLIPEGIELSRVGTGTPITRKHQRPYRARDLRRNQWGIGRFSVKSSLDYQLRRDPFAYRHD
ncbi:PIG-L family deacetylase [Ornithinimicrobium sp. F0845]|uniref:PIG-L deacetylase family protein n=1 Tax=Ornithinimicrobium sp. F0845 TaxID=2926412 RepID=UPI001FF5B633|nr:PIG-L family deacetylase [Ornithinimicrobium sp. F0845]